MKAVRAVRKLLLEARERGHCIMYWLSAVITWKLEVISNQVVNLAEDISRHNAESVIWLILAALSQELLNFQAEFR